MSYNSWTAGEEVNTSTLNARLGLWASKNANETVNNSATFQNDDALVLPVAANGIYLVRGFLIWTSGTTPDFKAQFTGPPMATYTTWSTWNLAAAAPNQLADMRAVIGTGSGGSVSIPGQGATLATTGQFTEISGSVVMSGTAGNFQLQWAQNTANATDTIVYTGSWLELVRVG
jgi:hypothetical protein